MGCAGSDVKAAERTTTSNVKVFGMPPSANAIGPVLLAMDAGCGGLEMCDLMKGDQMKPDFLAMNPFHHIPTLKDGDFAIGEGNACLRYLAMAYKPAYYPVNDPAATGWIDFAIESFCGNVYKPWAAVCYGVLGFGPSPADPDQAAKDARAVADTWATHFLKGKFVCGDGLSIADFKVAPFFFAACQPAIEKQGLIMSDRIKQYVEDFCAATSSSSMLKSAGGFSIAEFLASKAPGALTSAAFTKPTIAGKPAFGKASGKVQVYGMPPSANVMGPVLAAMEANAGGIEFCNIMEGANKTPEFLAMNPFHQIPTLKDGEYAIGESLACLRYIAMKYKPELYPVQEPQTCGRIDFAMESFGEVYQKWTKIVYPVLGFSGPTEDMPQANKDLNEILDVWTTHFLKDKFVCGDKLSIADIKVVPFFFALLQPGIQKKTSYEAPAKLKKYVDDVMATGAGFSMLSSAGGFSIAEYTATKAAE